MSIRYWLCDPGGQPQGPFALEQVREILSAGRVSPNAMSCPEGQTIWSPIAVLLSPSASPAPAPPPAAPAPVGGQSASDPGMGWVVPVSADPLAIVGSYLSLFGIVVPLLGPAAVVLAVVALRRRSRYPGSANLVRIIITLVLGLLGTLTTVAGLIGIVAATSARATGGGP